MPIDSTNYCSTSAFDAVSPLFHEVIAALESLNITVEQVQKKTHNIVMLIWFLPFVCPSVDERVVITSCFNSVEPLKSSLSNE